MDDALWAIGRGTGVAALVLFTASVVLGIVNRSGRSAAGLPRFAVTLVHRNVSLAATLFLVVHIVSLFFDPYAQLRLLDVVVPFFGGYRPFWQGLGTVGFDLVLVIVVSSLLRKRLGPRIFKALHWSAYALWPIALAHAIGNGTNGTEGWFLVLAAVSVAVVAAAVIWRCSPRFVEFRSLRSGETALRLGGAPLRPANSTLHPAGTPLHPAGAPLHPAGTPLHPADTALRPAGTPLRPERTTA